MGKFYEELSPKHSKFIEEQKMFFVGTAPKDGGSVNISPKGLECFKILSPTQVAYSNMAGSGNETSAHLIESSRMTLMFCSFDKIPLILRLYGAGREITPEDAEFEEFYAKMPQVSGIRQIFIMDIDRIQTSCGYGVPFYEFTDQRPTLTTWADKNGAEGVQKYITEKNHTSIDGLPTRVKT